MYYKIYDILSEKDMCTQHFSWNKIESDNGIVFPEDYKKFLEHYGAGAINDFLWILSPTCSNSYLNSFEQYKIMKSSYETMTSSHLLDCEYRFYDGGTGLFPWGITDNGDELYWNYLNDGMEIVVFSSRYENIFSFKMNMVDFLFDILTKKTECAAFPDDFVIDNNYFVSAV